MRSGSARKSGKAKAGGGDSHPHTHTRFRSPNSILGEEGAFSVPTRAAPAGVRTLRPFNNITPATPVWGRLPFRAGGIKQHLGPLPPPLPPIQGPRYCGWSTPGLSRFCKCSGGSGHRHALCFGSRGRRSGTRVSEVRGAGEARGRGSWEGDGAGALRRMRLTSLRRARGCPAAAATGEPFHLLIPPHPSSPKLASGQDSGRGWGEGLV